MEIYFEFLITYFVGVVIYPFFVIFWGVSAPIYIGVWFFISVLGIYLLLRYKKPELLKIFVAFFIMPGTIICGAATSVPWPMAALSEQSGSGCTPVWALLSSLVFNFALVHLGFYFIGKIKKMAARKKGITKL